MNKFEKLIEYVINEEDAKAEELFHEIVVAKSRSIYESLMDSDDELGGDEADELINDIESDENGMYEDDDDMEPEMGGMPDGDNDMDDMDDMAPAMGDEEGEADLENRVVDLEDQLDALMAEFDAVMGNEGEAEDEMGDEGEAEDEMGDEVEMGMEGMFNENVALTKVTKGISNSTEDGAVNKKSVNADNSGKRGMQGRPQQSTGEETGASTPSYKPGDATTAPRQTKVSNPKKTGEDASINKQSLVK